MQTQAVEAAEALDYVGTVKSMYRFPVKSLGGVAIDGGQIDAEGLVGDRQFGFLDLESGNICNAKHPRRFGSLLQLCAYYVDEPQLGAPLPVFEVLFPGGSTVRSDDGDKLNATVSEHLGRAVELVSTVPADAKTELVWLSDSGLDKTSVYADAVQNREGDHVASYDLGNNLVGRSTFFDLTALHLITTSTLDHFRKINPEGNFDARRYRPTMVVDAVADGLVEDAWVGGKVQLGDTAVADVLMCTPRCAMSTVEHAADVLEDRSTLRTIARHNRHELAAARAQFGCAGVYANVGAGGVVRVGDSVFLRSPVG